MMTKPADAAAPAPAIDIRFGRAQTHLNQAHLSETNIDGRRWCVCARPTRARFSTS